jgi:hypothetical protein
MINSEWPKREMGWKDELAHVDQHNPRRKPSMPKLRFMDGTKWGVVPWDGQEEDLKVEGLA